MAVTLLVSAGFPQKIENFLGNFGDIFFQVISPGKKKITKEITGDFRSDTDTKKPFWDSLSL